MSKSIRSVLEHYAYKAKDDIESCGDIYVGGDYPLMTSNLLTEDY